MKKWPVLVALILGFCLSLYFVTCHFFAPRDINLIKLESPLRAIVETENGSYNNAKIREAILQQLPMGSSRQQIENFLSRDFVDARYVVASSPPSHGLYQGNESHIFIRPVEVSNLGGGQRVEIYLLIGQSERLKDVIVKSDFSYL